MIVQDQSDVIAFLSRPQTWGREVRAVERRETHISVIFLAGDRAYKLKRAVRFPYLDYGTADLRHRFCESELAINQRTAGDLYRRVLPVMRRPDGGLALEGEGQPVDWLIEMQRFAEDALFDRLADAGRLDRFAIESLADSIARFHAEAERRPAAGGAAAIARILEGNERSFADTDPSVLARDRIEAVGASSRRALEALAPLLDRRSAEGFVRRCHGDLHLRNIIAREGRAVLFDAIEFDPALADIDVLYDLAFVVMDLQFRDLGRLASILLNRYLDVTGDSGGLAALPLFLSMRAAIRSHIDAAAARTQSSPEQARDLAAAASRYLDLSLRFLQPRVPRLVAIGGLSGSGKSRLARELAPCFPPPPGARVVRTDTTRKRLAGVDPQTRLAPRDYSEATNRRTYEAVYDEAGAALAAGQTVIADAVFARPEERGAIASVAAEAGVPFQGLWLDAAPPLLEQRVRDRVHNVSDATPQVVRLQLSFELGPIEWPRLDSSGAGSHTLGAAGVILGLEIPEQD
jgi:aminoglycoside phosphotransferase family enzyme/predicted kinase